MPNENWPAHNLASAIVESMRRHSRKPADFYPTPAEVTAALMLWLRFNGKIVQADNVWEPACGTGEMARVMERLGYRVLATDLRHTGYGLGGIDFLTTSNILAPRNRAIISNPPFTLAEAFIRRAIQGAPLVCMLLKSNYFNVDSRLKLWDDCTPTAHLPLTWRPAFLQAERGDSPLMDCDWWVWCEGDPKLPDRPLVRPHASMVPDIDGRPLLTHLVSLETAIDDLLETIDAGT